MTNDLMMIGQNDLRDQRERMIEDFGVTEEEAEKAFENVKTQVMLASQDQGKNWSNETVEAVTNLVIAIQHKQYANSNRRKSHFYDRLFRFITGSLMATFAGFGVFLVITGNYLFAGVFLLIWAAGMAFQHLSQ